MPDQLTTAPPRTRSPAQPDRRPPRPEIENLRLSVQHKTITPLKTRQRRSPGIVRHLVVELSRSVSHTAEPARRHWRRTKPKCGGPTAKGARRVCTFRRTAGEAPENERRHRHAGGRRLVLERLGVRRERQRRDDEGRARAGADDVRAATEAAPAAEAAEAAGCSPRRASRQRDTGPLQHGGWDQPRRRRGRHRHGRGGAGPRVRQRRVRHLPIRELPGQAGLARPRR